MQRPKVVHPFGTPVFTKISDSPTYAQSTADRAELDWLFSPKVHTPTLADRFVADLILQEAHEGDPHRRADLRIAQLTILWAVNGAPEWAWFANEPAHVAACYQVLNCHPDQVWEMVRKEREAKLAAEYPDWFDAAGNLRPDIPKKQSVTSLGGQYGGNAIVPEDQCEAVHLSTQLGNGMGETATARYLDTYPERSIEQIPYRASAITHHEVAGEPSNAPVTSLTPRPSTGESAEAELSPIAPNSASAPLLTKKAGVA